MNTAMPNVVDSYVQSDGIFRSPMTVTHREEDYDSADYQTLSRMQSRHFWYRGRHRFLLAAMARSPLTSGSRCLAGLRLIDIGGGCGGWLLDLMRSYDITNAELAIAESSPTALAYASQVLPTSVNRYHADLLNLQWRNRWDVVFLLDVLEHISEDAEALRQIRDSLAPGGLLFVTTPALMRFWSWNDDLALHRRRYSRPDFVRLAHESGLRLLDSRYFMFLLSPLLLASRWLSSRKVAKSSKGEAKTLQASMHSEPWLPVNLLLRGVLSSESPLGHYIRFPWGTSVLGIFQKPETSVCCVRRRRGPLSRPLGASSVVAQ